MCVAGHGKPDVRLDFVGFLKGSEPTGDGLAADTLATSYTRSKWDVGQP